MEVPPARLLIVDDHEDVRFLIKVIVGDFQDTIEVVAEADGAAAAMSQLDAAAPDVVVLDARMPIHDGFETAGMLLERRPGLPIILLTAYADDEIREKASAVGIREVLTKDQFDRIPEVALGLAGRAQL